MPHQPQTTKRALAASARREEIARIIRSRVAVKPETAQAIADAILALPPNPSLGASAPPLPSDGERMMDIQALIDAFSAASKSARGDYHLSLGGLIAALEAAPSDMSVGFDVGGHPTGPHSYRGYYEDLAFEVEDGDTSAAELLNECKAIHGTTLEGYKGGDFLMDDAAILWASSYGSSGGRAITGASITAGRLVLATREVA